MKLSDFDFDLPKELIAFSPVYPRNSSKMLAVLDSGILDLCFDDFIKFITPDDLLVFNDSKVIAAQLKGHINQKEFEFNLHKKIFLNIWKAFAKKTKNMHVGDEVIFGENLSAIITDINQGEVTLKFSINNPTELIDKYGKMPLPPYIKRPANESDESDYQTVYAKNLGSVAAPTAGLHFTEEIFAKFDEKKLRYCFVTLHVGAGTFLPVKTENILEHKMHSEYSEISWETANLINETKKRGGRVIVIGTTALRLLEFVALKLGEIAEFRGDNDIFITPGFNFKVADMLLTNFHLPKSTLFMLVSAFAGTDIMKQAYAHAIEKKYRFFSFGDCCLLTRK